MVVRRQELPGSEDASDGNEDVKMDVWYTRSDNIRNEDIRDKLK